MLAASTCSKTTKHRAELASWLQGEAHCRSYNGPDGPIKHKLQEASHALDTASVSVKKIGFRLFVRNARGKQRRMKLKERLAYFLLKDTEIRP